MVRLSSLLLVTLLAALAARGAAAQRVVLLDFSTPGCQPCRQMEPVVARMQQSGLPVRRVDAAAEPQIAQQFGVDRFPTFLLVVDGREVRRAIGPQPEHVLRGWLAGVQQLPVRVQGVRQGAAPPATFASSSFNAPAFNAPPVDGGGIRVGSDHGPAPRVTIPGVTPPPTQQLTPPAVTPPAAAAAPAVSGLADQLLRASVRLKVKEGGGASYGTGTVIDARQGEALVLTCGHLFRSDTGAAAGPPEIQVELFDAAGGAARVREQVVGQLLSFDLERDVALVSIRPRATPAVAKIAPSPTAASNGLPVWSVGCDRGADPTVRSGAVTSVDRYQSPPSLTVTGVPVVGRSGGGLFNGRGEIVGVCFGADEPGGEGFYAKLSSIHNELDKLNLTAIYRGGGPATAVAAAPPATAGVTAPFAAALGVGTPATSAAPGMVAVQPRTPPAVVRGQDSFGSGSLPALSATEQAALEELSRRASESEVVCVIRPREPGGKSEVLTLDRVTPEFLQALRSMGGVNR